MFDVRVIFRVLYVNALNLRYETELVANYNNNYNFKLTFEILTDTFLRHEV